ncbi:hypothetical protein V5799_027123 [Amblyomma americanum]|uniref:Cuticular protein n=1 Tax=Amblyomma americanum TaxID=6943 RepID=A0AAQ4DGM1_AMBAM
MQSNGNYRFGYDVVHSSGSSFHKEQSTNGVKVGSYGLRDIDGRVRVVNYVADAQGFRADVRTNEPGVAPMKDPAGATISRSPPVGPVPPVAFTVDHTGDKSGTTEEEPCDCDDETVSPVTEPTSPIVEVSGTPEVPEVSVSTSSATLSVSTAAPPSTRAEPTETEGKPATRESEQTSPVAQTGGDVAPPEILSAGEDVTTKPPPRRPKPRPSVFPPVSTPGPLPASSAPPAVDANGSGESVPPAAKVPGAGSVTPPKRTAVHLPRYPFYVSGADVHIIGPTGFHPITMPSYHRRPGGLQVAFHGGFPFRVSSAARPFPHPAFSQPFGSSYFPRVPQLSYAPRQPLFPPAFYANPALASAFFHSAHLGHSLPSAAFPGFPFGQPYHAPFLPPVVTFPF